ICTSQALLANMASFYAVYHGPQGLRRIALRVNAMARLLAALLAQAGAGAPQPLHDCFFDTLVFELGAGAVAAHERARSLRINLREFDAEGGPAGRVGVALDEAVGLADVADLAWVLGGARVDDAALDAIASSLGIEPDSIPASLRRDDPVLAHPVFNRYHSETGFMRYLKKLENRDISLVHSMIPLGSCTMKLNAASEMAPVTWPEFANLHPFAPRDQAAGYAAMLGQLGS